MLAAGERQSARCDASGCGRRGERRGTEQLDAAGVLRRRSLASRSGTLGCRPRGPPLQLPEWRRSWFPRRDIGAEIHLREAQSVRAAVFKGPGAIEVADRPDPVIKEPTDAVVRVVLACV